MSSLYGSFHMGADGARNTVLCRGARQTENNRFDVCQNIEAVIQVMYYGKINSIAG